MLTAERRQAILTRLERDGKVVASELVASLGVSEDTVRRDLRELASGGLVQRVHGGALLPPPANVSFAQRLEVAPEAKAHLAEAALPLLEGANVVLLDGGTTALELARRLPPDRACTVLTNAPPVAAALAAHPRAEVVLIGGRMLKDSQTTVGAEAIEALRQVRADACVLGICSVDAEVGITTSHHEEAHVKRAMVAASAEVIALATADKLQTASPWVVAPVADLTHLVTDAGEDVTAPYAAAGVSVVHA
ncbi:MAG TPA: DeoR/GlpR family DNA-binding transcription regulator [Solirubrobacteraceae bacterium]|jgi:DeoR/GlpR family transcriptional regulator of sugar metabolism|nr:DeoR/GlpR family DNA-binding transcription regulator [Solirubrobacteraceae bacterium]